MLNFLFFSSQEVRFESNEPLEEVVERLKKSVLPFSTNSFLKLFGLEHRSSSSNIYMSGFVSVDKVELYYSYSHTEEGSEKELDFSLKFHGGFITQGGKTVLRGTFSDPYKLLSFLLIIMSFVFTGLAINVFFKATIVWLSVLVSGFMLLIALFMFSTYIARYKKCKKNVQRVYESIQKKLIK